MRSVGERVRSGSVDSPGVDDGYLVPANPQIIELFSNSSGIENGLMVPTRE